MPRKTRKFGVRFLFEHFCFSAIGVFLVVGQGWGSTAPCSTAGSGTGICYIAQSSRGAGTGVDFDNAMSVDTHNSSSFSAGDTLYVCDEINSTISPPSSGMAGSPITYRGDCPGHAGVVKVLDKVSSWFEESPNIWFAPYNHEPTQVFIDGEYFKRAYYPCSAGSTPNTTYGLVTTADGNQEKTTFADSMLARSKEEVEASVACVRINSWVLQCMKVTNFTAPDITVASPFSYQSKSGSGYYLTDAKWMLNTGMWWWDSVNKRLYVYRVGTPTTGEISNQWGKWFGVNIGVKDYLTFDGLTVKQSGVVGIYGGSYPGTDPQDHIVIQNCKFSNNFYGDIYLYYPTNVTIQDNNSDKVGMVSMWLGYLQQGNGLIKSNTITNVGYGLPAKYVSIFVLGPVPFTPYAGIVVQNMSETILENNILQHLGYMGIRTSGNNNTIIGNTINNSFHQQNLWVNSGSGRFPSV